MRRNTGRNGLALLFGLVLALPGIADDLTELQKQKLEKAQAALKQVVTNLQLAENSAGSGTSQPKGSRAKLAKMRLDSSAVNVPEVKRWLADLPVDHADVKTLQAALDDAENSIAALEARLTGKAASTKPVPDKPKDPNGSKQTDQATPMKAAPSTVKMGYQQVDILKAAKFNLREVEGNTAALTKLLDELQPVKDQLSIDHRVVQSAMNTIQNAQRKAGFTKDGLDQLPANGDGVAETVKRLEDANAQIAASIKFLEPLHKKLSDLINPANYPDFNSDMKRLNELNVMYRDPNVFQTDRTRAARVLAEVDAAKAEVTRIAKAYVRLMAQKTEEGKRVEGSGNNFLQTLDRFLVAAEQQKLDLPNQIRKELGQADEMANKAVEEQKPLFFTGGIPQVMGFAQEKIDLFTVLAPNQAPAIQKEFDQTKANLKQREKSLEKLIIQQNNLPPDNYKGSDREKIVAVAVDAWKYQQKQFDVLTSRIPSEAWSRETMWQYSNGTWYFVDRSKLQVQLIIADENDKRLAIIRPVTIIMNHQKGDSLIGTPMYSGDDELQPSAYLLKTKIK